MYDATNIDIYLNKELIKDYYINSLDLKGEYSKHTYFDINIKIDVKDLVFYEKLIYENDVKIKFEIRKESNIKTVFEGYIKKIEIKNFYSNFSEINIKSISKTIEMDRKNEYKFRVYQDLDLTYKDLIEDILKNYNFQYKLSKNLNEKIKKIYVQYFETDFCFLNRLLSSVNSFILISDYNVLIFGNEKLSASENIDYKYLTYSIIKEEENILKNFSSNEIFITGNIVSFDKKEEIVIKYNINLNNTILYNDFLVLDNKDFKIDEILNNKIQGGRIEALVTKVLTHDDIAKMEVDFSEGLKKLGTTYNSINKKNYPMSYKTFYSKTNTGFFCTPEINDVVEVYFSSCSEESAKISWSINNPGSGRFSDYEKRNFRTFSNNFNFSFSDKDFFFNVANNMNFSSKTISAISENLSFKTYKNIVLIADKELSFESLDNFYLTSSKIDLVSNKGDISFKSNEDIKLIAKKIHNN